MTHSNEVNRLDIPDVSIVLVNYNTGHLLDRLFSSLNAATSGLRIEIVMVDNASADDSLKIIQSDYRYVELLKNATNVGFGRANNQAVQRVRGRYILLLNTDAFVMPDTLLKTVEYMDGDPKCGVLGVKLIGSDGTLQPCCRYFPNPWNVFLTRSGLVPIFRNSRLVDDMNWDHASVRQCDWVPGCYYLVRSEVVRDIGLFDPRFFLYYEEVDHCRRAKEAGWRVIFYPLTAVVHIGGESAKSTSKLTRSGRQIPSLQIESELLYFRKHYGVTGLIAAILLGALADVFSLSKGILRRPNDKSAVSILRHTASTLRVLLKTNFASRPTR